MTATLREKQSGNSAERQDGKQRDRQEGLLLSVVIDVAAGRLTAARSVAEFEQTVRNRSWEQCYGCAKLETRLEREVPLHSCLKKEHRLSHSSCADRILNARTNI